jgi:hypothetical protein
MRDTHPKTAPQHSASCSHNRILLGGVKVTLCTAKGQSLGTIHTHKPSLLRGSKSLGIRRREARAVQETLGCLAEAVSESAQSVRRHQKANSQHRAGEAARQLRGNPRISLVAPGWVRRPNEPYVAGSSPPGDMGRTRCARPRALATRVAGSQYPLRGSNPRPVARQTISSGILCTSVSRVALGLRLALAEGMLTRSMLRAPRSCLY